jgi:hypothetical protein
LSGSRHSTQIMHYLTDIFLSFLILILLLIVGAFLAPIVLFFYARHRFKLRFDKSYVPYNRSAGD